MTNEIAGQTASSIGHLIAPEKLGYSRLYLDFVERRSPVTEFFPSTSIEAVAEELDRVEYARDRIADILLRQNRLYGASELSLERAEQLREPRAVCLFTGQQAGLFGGPLLTLVKALGVVKAAQMYSERLRRPVIPIFWIAGDDHDFEEANHTFVIDRKGSLVRHEYGCCPDPEPPVAEVLLDDTEEWTRLKGLLRDSLGETDFTAELLDAIDRAYTPEDTLVTGFAKFMAHITRRTGLILFNPADTEAKELAAPLLRDVIEKHDRLHTVLATREQQLRQAGYHLQVEKKPAAGYMFFHQDGRTPIMRRGDDFTAGEMTWSESGLLAEIVARPELFSPDVLTRPIMQSYLFPVISQKCGASEIAYMAQLLPLFDLFDLPAPVHVARPTLTLVDKRSEQLMSDLEIALEDLTGDVEQIVNRVLGETFPVDLQSALSELRQRIEQHFGEFVEEALSFDPGQRRNAEQVRGKIDYLLNGFESRLFAAHKKKSQQTRDRVYRLADTLYPRRQLQERSINIGSFLARYGSGVVGHLLDRIDCEQSTHQLIFLSEYEA